MCFSFICPAAKGANGHLVMPPGDELANQSHSSIEQKSGQSAGQLTTVADVSTPPTLTKQRPVSDDQSSQGAASGTESVGQVSIPGIVMTPGIAEERRSLSKVCL